MEIMYIWMMEMVHSRAELDRRLYSGVGVEHLQNSRIILSMIYRYVDGCDVIMYWWSRSWEHSIGTVSCRESTNSVDLS